MGVIKRILKKIPFAVSSYYKILEKKSRIERNVAVRKKGIVAISTIQECLKSADVKFFFDMGTLLGIIREGRLLKHDLDIDVGVICDSEEEKKRITDYLVQLGCKEKYRYTIDEFGIVEQSFVYLGIKFDINYYYNSKDKSTCYLFYRKPGKTYPEMVMDVVELSSPPITDIEKYNFQGRKVNIPCDAETYLARRYGSNWRLPDKKYIYWKGPSATNTDYIGKVKDLSNQ